MTPASLRTADRLTSATWTIILAGGRGTRISHLYPDVPKPWVEAAGRPFIEWVLAHLAGHGLRRHVLALGHKAEVATAHLAARADDGLVIRPVCESAPLGTAGALPAAAAAAPHGDRLVITNGDTLVVGDVRPAIAALDDPAVDAALVAVEVTDASRYGTVAVDADGCLTRFEEKRPGRGWINAGTYVLRRSLIEGLPARRPLSIETDVFPALLARKSRIAVVRLRVPFLDIGTPDTVRQAEEFVRQHFIDGSPGGGPNRAVA